MLETHSVIRSELCGKILTDCKTRKYKRQKHLTQNRNIQARRATHGFSGWLAAWSGH
jgi:hypothetical protein